MLLNAREVVNQRNARKLILLTIEDVTERRAAERRHGRVSVARPVEYGLHARLVARIGDDIYKTQARPCFLERPRI
jgi:hypothetical protein